MPPCLPRLPAGLGVSTPNASARLKHTYEVKGANTVEIVFVDTEVKLAGGLSGWLDSVPRFTLPSLPEALQVGAVGSAQWGRSHVWHEAGLEGCMRGWSVTAAWLVVTS